MNYRIEDNVIVNFRQKEELVCIVSKLPYNLYGVIDPFDNYNIYIINEKCIVSDMYDYSKCKKLDKNIISEYIGWSSILLSNKFKIIVWGKEWYKYYRNNFIYYNSKG